MNDPILNNRCHYHPDVGALDICFKCNAPLCLTCKRLEIVRGVLTPTCVVCTKLATQKTDDESKMDTLKRPYRIMGMALFLFAYFYLIGLALVCIHFGLGIYQTSATTSPLIVACLVAARAYTARWFGPITMPPAKD